MKLLAFETSTDACSVALEKEGSLWVRTLREPRTHAQKLLFLINEILSESKTTLSDLDAIVYGRGPGSFTGLRIASSVAQGLAIVDNLPVIPISSLLTFAQTAYTQKMMRHAFVCLNARMQEVYFAECQIIPENSAMELVGQESLFSYEAAAKRIQEAMRCSPIQDFVLLGDGIPLLPLSDLTDSYSIRENIYPEAIAMLDLAKIAFSKKQWVSAEEALPVYLREMKYSSKGENSL